MGGEIKTIIFGIVVCVAISCLISELEAKEISRSTKSELEAVSQVSTQAAACKCTNGYCEKDNNGKLVCKCRVEYGLDTSGDKCTKCNCGSNANCTFTKGFFGGTSKDCLCPKGSYLDKTCKSCNCGKDFDCSYSIWSGKNCTCGTGYSERRGVCVGTCDSNPCKNNGKCEVKGEDIECQCKSPFTGEFCEERDICASVKCRNGGICYLKNGKPYCNCTERYAGNTCQTDKCSVVKCLNGGYCYIKDGKALCRCTERFIGDKCQTDKCSTVKCQNGGQCKIKEEKAFCNCTERYTGDNCQTDKCSSVTCLNGGQCNIKNGKTFCNCTERYTGANCQTVDDITNATTSEFGSTTYPPLSTQKEFSQTLVSTVPPSSTDTEKMISPTSTESPTRATKTSPTLELIKSFVVKVLIYEEKI